ncbi:hypothetical protein D3C71_1637450 [compost metagenome]
MATATPGGRSAFWECLYEMMSFITRKKSGREARNDSFAPPKGKVGSSNLPWDTIYFGPLQLILIPRFFSVTAGWQQKDQK